MKKTIKTETIINFMENNNLGKTDFCKQCKISIRTLNKILENNDNNVIALFKIARILNVGIPELYR